MKENLRHRERRPPRAERRSPPEAGARPERSRAALALLATEAVTAALLLVPTGRVRIR